MKINVAVTSSGSAPAVAVIKALREQNDLDIHITGLDMDPASSGGYLADRSLKIPPSDDPSFIRSVLKVCKKYNIQCLIPIIDEELFVFAKSKDIFENAGIKLIVNNEKTIKLAKNKYLTYQFCTNKKILSPKTFLSKDINKTEKFVYPLFIKPLDGRGSRDVAKIRDKKELNFFKEYFKNYIIQEYIEGQEYTIDIVAFRNKDIMQAIPRQRIVVKAGQSYKGRTVKDPKLVDYGKYIAKEFDIDGPANVQCIVSKDRIYLIEVNPKFGAGLPLTVAAGVNVPLVLIKSVFGLRIKEKEMEFKDGIFMFRYWEEIFVSRKGMFK